MINNKVKIHIEEQLNKLHIASKIRAIICYGSWARGNYEEDSDIDVLVIVESACDKYEQQLEEILAEIDQEKMIDLAIYDADKFETLLTCGSLFLHHIKNEGEVLYARKGYTKERLFGKLNEFKGISEDMLLYQRMFVKAKQSIEINGINYYDLNILSLLARNIQILICYQKGEATFGKQEVYVKCKKIFGDKFAFNTAVYGELLKYRSYYNRKTNKIDLPEKERCKKYLEEVKGLIDLGIDVVGVHNAIDRIYFIFEDGVGRNLYTSYELFTDFDRDVFIYINRYLTNYYNQKIDSIRELFLAELLQQYPNDEFIQCVCSVIGELQIVKKKSSNYAIDVPDVYSEIHLKKNYQKIETLLGIEKGTFIVKIADFLKSKFTRKTPKDVMQLLQEMRSYIENLEL